MAPSQSMAEIRVDESRSPIVVVTFPERIELVDYQRVVARYVEIAQRGVPVGWLIDMVAFNPLIASPTARRQAAQAVEPFIKTIRTVSAGEARVVPNSIVRGVSTAFTWVTDAHWPTSHFARHYEAEEWLVRQLQTFKR